MNVTLLHCTVTQSKYLWIETEFKIKLYKSGKLHCCRMLLGVAWPWKLVLQSSQSKVFVLILIPEDVWNSAVAELAKSWWVRFSTQRRRSVRFCGWVSKLRSSFSDGVLPCLNSLRTVLGVAVAQDKDLYLLLSSSTPKQLKLTNNASKT